MVKYIFPMFIEFKWQILLFVFCKGVQLINRLSKCILLLVISRIVLRTCEVTRNLTFSLLKKLNTTIANLTIITRPLKINAEDECFVLLLLRYIVSSFYFVYLARSGPKCDILFRDFSVSRLLKKIECIGIGLENIWSQKRVSVSVSKDFSLKKSLKKSAWKKISVSVSQNLV